MVMDIPLKRSFLTVGSVGTVDRRCCIAGVDSFRRHLQLASRHYNMRALILEDCAEGVGPIQSADATRNVSDGPTFRWTVASMGSSPVRRRAVRFEEDASARDQKKQKVEQARSPVDFNFFKLRSGMFWVNGFSGGVLKWSPAFMADAGVDLVHLSTESASAGVGMSLTTGVVWGNTSRKVVLGGFGGGQSYNKDGTVASFGVFLGPINFTKAFTPETNHQQKLTQDEATRASASVDAR